MKAFLNPKEVLDEINLKKDMVAAEFGCGSGGFSVSLAKRLEDGLVYGLDIQEAPLSALKSRTQMENIKNIRIIRCDLENSRGSTLADLSLDLVLIPNLLFQAEDKTAIISEAKRILKEGGKLVVVEWLPKAVQGPAKGRVSPEKLKKTAEEKGFKMEKEFEAGRYHYGIIFKKP